MFYEPSPKTQQLLQRLNAFYAEHIYPSEARHHHEVDAFRRAGNAWQTVPVVEELKAVARKAGLWNMFLPHAYNGEGGISNLDYAPLCEVMGRVSWSGEVFNCSAPDTGNMETLERYATAAQKKQWLEPLLAGEIRSAFLMTEPAVASSDATNIQCDIRRESTSESTSASTSSGDNYVINGRKWFSSGAGSPRCAIFIVMGKTDADGPRHAQQSMVLVPRSAPGVTVERHLSVFGYDDAPHGHMEVVMDNVRVPASSILLPKVGVDQAVSTTITAKKMTVKNQDSQAVFEGAVVLTRGSLVVYSDRMVVMFREQDAPASDNQKGHEAVRGAAPSKGPDAVPAVSNRSVNRIEATGRVKIEKDSGSATCEKAIYYHDGDKIVLTGDPVAWDKGTRVSGKQITMFLAEDQIGRASCRERV